MKARSAMKPESDAIVWRADTEDGGSVWVHANGEWGHEGGALPWALDGMAQHIAALLEEHRKALVRAKNEGLEKAAVAIEAHAKRPDDFDLAHGIRAMMEPE